LLKQIALRRFAKALKHFESSAVLSN